jgi:hypothetical protein
VAAFSLGIEGYWYQEAEKLDVKKPLSIAASGFLALAELLQLDFFVFHMLASFWIKFHDQHFVGRGLLVLGGRVKVTCAGG